MIRNSECLRVRCRYCFKDALKRDARRLVRLHTFVPPELFSLRMTKENRNFQPCSQGPLLLVPPHLSLSRSGGQVGKDPGNEAGKTVAELLSSHEQP